MKNIYIFIGFLFLTSGYSQFNPIAPWMNSDGNAKQGETTIDDMTNSFNEYWSTHDRKKKGSGYKPFMRWQTHWKNKTNEQGYLITPQEMWAGWESKRQVQTNKAFSPSTLPVSNWQPIGPIGNANLTSTSARGRVTTVCVDPSNPNTIYTVSYTHLDVYKRQ